MHPRNSRTPPEYLRRTVIPPGVFSLKPQGKSKGGFPGAARRSGMESATASTVSKFRIVKSEWVGPLGFRACIHVRRGLHNAPCAVLVEFGRTAGRHGVHPGALGQPQGLAHRQRACLTPFHPQKVFRVFPQKIRVLRFHVERAEWRMRLLDLEPVFLRYVTGPNGEDFMHHGDPPDVTLGEADAVMFVCPKCYAAQGRPGSHSVICNRPRVPLGPNRVGPGRWEFSGTGLADLTLTAGSSSIALQGRCGAHFFILGGDIIMA